MGFLTGFAGCKVPDPDLGGLNTYVSCPTEPDPDPQHWYQLLKCCTFLNVGEYDVFLIRWMRPRRHSK
jgi:hypothetical protein